MPVTINGTTGIAGPDGSASTPAVQGTDSNTGLFYPAADTVALSTGGSERMRITSAGSVGIGTSSPDRPLTVYSATTAGANPWTVSQANLYDSRAMAAGVGGTLQLTGNYTTGGGDALMAWIRASKRNATNADYSGDLLLGARDGDIKLYTAANPTIDGTNQVFTVKIGGTVILNGGSASATGVGITFPATQSASTDANTLDDYEEGSYTPTDSSGASLSFTDAYGYYTKVGRLVTYNFAVTYPSTASGSIARISLPFTQSNGMNTNANTGGFMFYVYAATTSAVMPIIGSGNNYLNMYFQSSMNDVTNADLSGRKLRGIVIFYT